MKTVMLGSIVVLIISLTTNVLYFNRITDLRTLYLNQLITFNGVTSERDRLWCQFIGSNNKHCEKKGDK